jgi:3-deoxy-D-manno-octulosonate 8-phosphate phosphatase (KDO 8-P phosphatase)
MIILDVDGVLTDGKVIFSSDGKEYRNFHAHDGFGIVRAKSLGIKFAAISGKTSKATEYRMARLDIKELHQNHMDKVAMYRKLKAKYKLHDREICYVGDDEFDLPLLRMVGFSAAPYDAVPAVRREVDYVASIKGGRGAVREVIDMILHEQKLL